MPDRDLMRDTLTALSALPVEVGRMSSRLDSVGDRLAGLDEWVREVDDRAIARDETLRALIGEVRKELRIEIGEARTVCNAISKDVKDGRRNILIAIIGFGGTLCAALVSAAVALIIHFA